MSYVVCPSTHHIIIIEHTIHTPRNSLTMAMQQLHHGHHYNHYQQRGHILHRPTTSQALVEQSTYKNDKDHVSHDTTHCHWSHYQ